jgi:valyl-tRNA synthetase
VKFGWYELCDWYLEATKAPRQRETRAAVLSFALNVLVRLLHPIAPFITEEIWQSLPHDGDSIVTASWPETDGIPRDDEAVKLFATIVGVVESARNLRAELGLPPKEKMTLEIPAALAPEIGELLAVLIHAELRPVAAPATGDAQSAHDLVRAVVPLAPVALMRDRYGREIVKLDGEIARLEKKLGSDFALKAPPGVVAKEREKLDGYSRDRDRARTALAELGDAT